MPRTACIVPAMDLRKRLDDDRLPPWFQMRCPRLSAAEADIADPGGAGAPARDRGGVGCAHFTMSRATLRRGEGPRSSGLPRYMTVTAPAVPRAVFNGGHPAALST